MAILVILYLNACTVTYVQVYTLFGQSVLLVSCRIHGQISSQNSVHISTVSNIQQNFPTYRVLFPY